MWRARNTSRSLAVSSSRRFPERGGRLGRDDCVNGRRGHERGPAGAQVEGRSLPAADDTLVPAGGAPPLNRRRHVGAVHGEMAGTWPSAGTPATWEGSDPRLTAIAGGRSAHDQRQVLGHPTRRPGSSLGHVEEVAKVGDEHVGDGIADGRMRGDQPRYGEQVLGPSRCVDQTGTGYLRTPDSVGTTFPNRRE